VGLGNYNPLEVGDFRLSSERALNSVSGSCPYLDNSPTLFISFTPSTYFEAMLSVL
jgi:hypothetical protein